MRSSVPSRAWLAGLLVLGASVGMADAAVITPDPLLPTKDGQYVLTSGPVGCFSGLPYCTIPGGPSGLTPLSVNFDASGETIHWQALYSFILTLSDLTPVSGPIALTGTLDERIVGRTGATDTGTWTTDVFALTLAGQFNGYTITAALDPSKISTGQTSLLPLGNQFAIESHIDIFADLSVTAPSDSVAQLSPAHLELVSVAEPAAYSILGFSLFSILSLRRRGPKSPRSNLA